MIIKTSEFITSAVKRNQYPVDVRPEVAFVGRSNVGKSSIINALTNRRKLAKVSQTPGKTRLINFFLINNDFYLVDAPGYGFANVSKSLKENFGAIMENYLETRENLKMVFMLVDFRHKPTEDDILMYKFLKYYNLPVTIICTKYDKVNRSARIKQDELIKNTLTPDLGDEIVNFSSVTKFGKDRIYEIIENIINKNS